MRHLSKLQGRVNLKFEWFDSESDILRQTIHEKRAEAGRRARCQRVLYKAIRRERRLRGLADRKSRSVSRFSSRVGADAQVKRRIIKLEFLDAKLPALGDEAPPMGPEGSSIRFAGGAPSRDAAAARVVAVVTHGAHRRLASLYDPDPVARTLASQGFAEKMEFYIDEEDYKTESLRVDLFMVRPSTTKSPETYQRIGFCSLETAHANKGQKQPFIERATAFGAGGDENGVPEVTSSNPGTGTSDAKESEAGPEAETDGETETKTECVPMWIDLSLPGDMDEGKGVLAAPPAKERLQGGRILVKLSYSEAVKPEERAVMKASVALPEFGVSMIDSTPEELFFFQVKGLYLEYEDSPINSTAEVSVFSTQLDNCLSNAQFSTVLAPEAVAPDDRKPFLVIAFNQAKTAEGVPVTIFPYVSVLMQKLKLSIEERVLWRLWGYIQEFAAQQKDLLGMVSRIIIFCAFFFYEPFDRYSVLTLPFPAPSPPREHRTMTKVMGQNLCTYP